MLNKTLTKEDEDLIITLSKTTSKYDKYIILLKNEYGYSLSKTNLAQVLNCSEQNLSRRIKDAINIPEYLKTGNGQKSSYRFMIIDVAEYICNTIKTI